MLSKLSATLNKISFIQLALIIFLSLVFFLSQNYSIFTALLISGTASFFYTQLIRLGKHNKLFALFGFPVRLILIVPLCAILVHKLHSNLLALFIGFFLCQAVYFINIWYYSKKITEKPSER